MFMVETNTTQLITFQVNQTGFFKPIPILFDLHQDSKLTFMELEINNFSLGIDLNDTYNIVYYLELQDKDVPNYSQSTPEETPLIKFMALDDSSLNSSLSSFYSDNEATMIGVFNPGFSNTTSDLVKTRGNKAQERIYFKNGLYLPKKENYKFNLYFTVADFVTPSNIAIDINVVGNVKIGIDTL